MQIETKRIEEYTLVGFVQAVLQGVADGYRVDVESNANYPMQIGALYFCTMLKGGEVQEVAKSPVPAQSGEGTAEPVDDTPEEDGTKPVLKRGPKPKA